MSSKDKKILEAEKAIAQEQKKKAEEKKPKKAKAKDPNKKTLKMKTKETFGELKKVAWPSFGKVVKNTGIVLAFVAVFTVVLLGIDFGLSKLHELLIK